MTPLAPVLEAFFTERLMHQRQASKHTVAAYRDTFRLLLRFAHAHLGKEPAQLLLGDLPDRERLILTRRFGLDGREPETLGDIARALR